jgi:hypothetical protein
MASTENIKRIMSSFLRMVGGKLSWISGTLHLRNEDDTAFNNVSAGNAELDSVTLKDPTRTTGITLTASPNADYNLVLPTTQPLAGDVLRSSNSSQLVWSPAISNLEVPVEEHFPLVYGLLSYPLAQIARIDLPIQVMINGLEVDFTISGNTITITTYSSGEVDSSDELRIYYYI